MMKAWKNKALESKACENVEFEDVRNVGSQILDLELDPWHRIAIAKV